MCKVREMNTKTMIEKYQEKGYTVEDLQVNWKEHEGTMTYPEWVSMMKQTVEKIPAKSW